jgi:hypothetical protein
MSGGLSADFVNATDGVERNFSSLTYIGRNPNIMLVDDCDNNRGEYFVYGRADMFKSDKKYRFCMKDDKDNSQSFKLHSDTTEHSFWARVISKIPFTSLGLGLYDPFNCESPRKSTNELADVLYGLNSTKSTPITPLVKQPKALI